MSKRLKSPTPLAVQRAINTLLEGAYWPSTLSAMERYSRIHDDCEGNPMQEISVIIGPDSDAHVVVPGAPTLRFRTYFGGGMSMRTRNALLVLAEAIRRDNEERSQDHIYPMRRKTPSFRAEI